MTTFASIKLVLLVVFGMSNYWTCWNEVSAASHRRSYNGIGNELNFYQNDNAVLDILDNSLEVEVQSEQEQATCPQPKSPREFRKMSNQIQHRAQETLGCEPRDQIMNLPNDDPRADLVPSVALVKRCDGYCYGQTNRCKPVSESITLRKVIVLKILRHQEPHCEILHEVEIEEHGECQCERMYFE